MLDLTLLEQLTRAAPTGLLDEEDRKDFIKFLCAAANPSTILKMLSVIRLYEDALKRISDPYPGSVKHETLEYDSIADRAPSSVALGALYKGRDILEGNQE